MRSFRGINLRYFALLLGLIALGMGIYTGFFKGKDYVKTEAVIVSVELSDTSTVDDEQYDVTVRYTVDGKEYTGLLDTYSPSYEPGNPVSIKYNPQNPADITTDSVFFPLLIGGVGLAVLAVTILAWFREKKNQSRLEQRRDAINDVTYLPSVPGPERELYFLTDLGTPKYGHRIEDGARRVLYEAKMTKYTALAPFGFDFIDHVRGTTTPHLIGHQENTDWDMLLIDNHSTFTFDGEYIWKHLKRSGVTVDSALSRQNVTKVGFRIFRDGVQIATAEQTSQHVHEEDEAAHKLVSKIAVPGFYRIHTTETNLDLLFVTLLAFARTDATADNGGNLKTVWNTLRGN